MEGFNYVLTLVGPSQQLHPGAHQIFQTVRVSLLSSQGAVISLTYCFLSCEVREVLLARWRRWRLVRRVTREYNQKTARTELSIIQES